MVEMGGRGKIQSVRPGEYVYEREASSLTSPVSANTSSHELINWQNPNKGKKRFLLLRLGTDAHDNSEYYWYVDDVELPISGSARVGTVMEPFMFPVPILCEDSIKLKIVNDNDVAYPNEGDTYDDQIPYEGMFDGVYEQ
jgi:hypothetical protein